MFRIERRNIVLGVAILAAAVGWYAAIPAGVESELPPTRVQKYNENVRRDALSRVQGGGGDMSLPNFRQRSGLGLVSCDLDIDSAGILTGSIKSDDRFDGVAMLVGRRLLAKVPAGSGSARFEFDVARGYIEWDGLVEGESGVCTTGTVDTLFTGLYGRLEGQQFQHARVTGCGGDVAVDGDEFFMSVRAPLDCDVWVVVMTETEIANGPRVTVHTNPDEDSEVVLMYPKTSDLEPFPPELVAERKSFADMTAWLSRQAESE